MATGKETKIQRGRCGRQLIGAMADIATDVGVLVWSSGGSRNPALFVAQHDIHHVIGGKTVSK
jgi:hypothetical protein